MKAILALEGSTLEEVKTVAKAKNNKRGGFEKKNIFGKENSTRFKRRVSCAL